MKTITRKVTRQDRMNHKTTAPLTAWILLDRNTGNSVMVDKDETKVRIECETRNMKVNRERFYVRPYDI